MDERFYEERRPSDFDHEGNLNLFREYQRHRVRGFARRKKTSQTISLGGGEYRFEDFDSEGLEGIAQFVGSVRELGVLEDFSVSSDGALMRVSPGSLFYFLRGLEGPGKRGPRGFKLNVLNSRGKKIMEELVSKNFGLFGYFYKRFFGNCRRLSWSEYLGLAYEAWVTAVSDFNPFVDRKFSTYVGKRLVNIGGLLERDVKNSFWAKRVKKVLGGNDVQGSGEGFFQSLSSPPREVDPFNDREQIWEDIQDYLSPLEREVIFSRYRAGRTQRETARILLESFGIEGITKRDVRQIEETALKNLRRRGFMERWKDYSSDDYFLG